MSKDHKEEMPGNKHEMCLLQKSLLLCNGALSVLWFLLTQRTSGLCLCELPEHVTKFSS